MEEEHVRKAEIKKAKKGAGASKRKTTKQVPPPSEEPLASAASTSTASTSAASTSSATTSTATSNLRNRATSTADPESEIDVNVCCTCFVRYEDDIISGSGADWISCTCGRWLHEDCAEDCVLDKDGKEHLCPFCLDIYT